MLRQALEGELRLQLGPQMADVMAKAIDMAKAGDGQMIKLLVDKCLQSPKDDVGGDEQPRVQIMIGKLPERKEDIVINEGKAK